MDNIEELFENSFSKSRIIKFIIYLLKKVFCIITIKKNKVCILPYKKLRSKFIIKIIIKIIAKTTNRVVLSNYLAKTEKIEEEFSKKNIYIHKGDVLKNYLLYNFIDYISKCINKEIYTQEIFILINSLDSVKENTIINLAKNFKRLNIVTKNIKHFKKLENYLETELGIGVTITNNRRKSLLKAKIIINMEFCEELINSFNINSKAVIIQMNNNIYIQSKLFNGVNILDYQIVYKKEVFEDMEYKKFSKKELYESRIYNREYKIILKQIEEDEVKIVNLLGRNGIINKKEYDILV